MSNYRFRNFTTLSFWSTRMLLSVALPIVLVLAFLGKQVINVDVIGWNNGFQHPLEGWDHLVTMLAVGIWAAQMRGHAIWMLPLAFVSVMSLGGLAGAAGLSIPSVEGIILLSCAVFSVLITRKIRFNAKVNVLIVAFFAFFHGFAHGQEISTSASLISYTLGFMFATLLLHGAGILVAKLLVLVCASLFTVFFANTSQANAVDSVSLGPIKFINLNQAQLLAYGFDFTQFEQNVVRDCQEKLKQGPPTAKFIQTNLQVSTTVLAPPKLPAMRLVIDSPQQGLTFKNAKLQWLNARMDCVVPTPVDVHLNQSEFNHINPDINNSPGIGLLSNGVGLTSPPESIYFSATSAISRFKPSTASIEEPVPGLFKTQIPSSKRYWQSLTGFRDSFALRFGLTLSPNFTTATINQVIDGFCSRTLLVFNTEFTASVHTGSLSSVPNITIQL